MVGRQGNIAWTAEKDIIYSVQVLVNIRKVGLATDNVPSVCLKTHIQKWERGSVNAVRQTARDAHMRAEKF